MQAGSENTERLTGENSCNITRAANPTIQTQTPDHTKQAKEELNLRNKPSR